MVHNRYRVTGGEETNVDTYQRLLTAAGHRVIAFEQDSRSLDDRGPAGKLSLPFEMLHSRSAASSLEALLESVRPDVAHVHNLYPLLSPSVLDVLAAHDVPIVMSLHNYRLLAPCGVLFRDGSLCEECTGGNYLPMFRHRCRGSLSESVAYGAVLWVHRARGRVLDRVARFIAPSRALLDRMASLIPHDRLVHLPYPFPEGDPAPSVEPKHLLYIGRLVPEKGVHELVEAAARCPEVPLAIAGDGPEMTALGQRIASRGAANVRMLGRVGPDERNRLLEQAAAVIVPSIWYENYPYSALEALTSGRPVIASAIGGLPEIVEDGINGWLVPPGSVEALAAAIRQAWEDPDRTRRLGEAAAARLPGAGRPAEALEGILSVYRSVARPPGES